MRISRAFRAAALAAAVFAFGASAAFGAARGALDFSDQEVAGKTLSATVFVFFHELGHALISELDLPTVGREEDVVDEFASYVLIEISENDPAASQMLIDAAESWKLSHERTLREGGQQPFWDEHGMDLQRYYNIICMLYGSDPAKWEKIAMDSGMPKERAERCIGEYRHKAKAWDTIMQPHLFAPGVNGSANRGVLKISYAAAQGNNAKLRDVLQRTGLLEVFVNGLNKLFRLPRHILVAPQECNETNAFWDSSAHSIVLCYELLEDFWTLYADAKANVQIASNQPDVVLTPVVNGPGGTVVSGPVVNGPGGTVVNGPVVNTSLDTSGTQVTAGVNLVGAWRIEPANPGKPAATLQFDGEGKFYRIEDGPPRVQSWGKYAVAKGGRVTLTIEGWSPYNYCDQTGCLALKLPEAETMTVKMVDADTVDTDLGRMTRVK